LVQKAGECQHCRYANSDDGLITHFNLTDFDSFHIIEQKDEALLLRTDFRIEKSSYDRNEINAAEQRVGGIGLPTSIVAGSTSAAI
jgi:hypothetical protein